MRKILFIAAALISAAAHAQTPLPDSLGKKTRDFINPRQVTVDSNIVLKKISAGTSDMNTVVFDDVNKTFRKGINFDSIYKKVSASNTGDTLDILGNSYEAGQGLSGMDYAYPTRLAAYIQKAPKNMAYGGAGLYYAVVQLNKLTPAINSDRMLLIGGLPYNDMRIGGNGYRTFRKVQNAYTTLLANHFLGSAVAASDASVTKGGSWTAQDLSGLGTKAGNGISGTAMYTFSSGATMTLTFTGDNLWWDEYVIDSVLARGGSYTLVIDGVSYGTYSQDAQTDGFNDGAGNSSQQMPNSRVVWLPTSGSHTAVFTTTTTNLVYLDAFGTLMPFTAGAPVLVTKIPKMLPNSYAIGSLASPSFNHASDAIFNSGDSLVALAAAPFIARNYPVTMVDINKYFTLIPANFQSDSVHPSNDGHGTFLNADADRLDFKSKTGLAIVKNVLTVGFKRNRIIKFGDVPTPNTAKDVMGFGTLNPLDVPYWYMNNPSAATNAKLYDVYVDASGVMHWRVVNDANTGSNEMMAFYRTGITPDSIYTVAAFITEKTVKSLYVNLGVDPAAAADKPISMGQFSSGLTYPYITFVNTGAASDYKKWQMYADGTDFIFRVLNDAKSGDNPIFNINRTGTTVNYFKHSTPVLLPASGYLNYGATAGSSGYGIRDNAGTIEIKNSGGSWAAPGGSGPSTRIYGGTQVTGTDANLTAAAGTILYLPSATLTAARTIDMSALNTDLDYIEINNTETGFAFTFTGQTVYESDRTSVVTTVLANTNYIIRRVSGKLVIIN